MPGTTVSVRAEAVDTQAILTSLQERIGLQKYNAWFRHGTNVTVQNGHVQVLVPNPFVASWIENH